MLPGQFQELVLVLPSERVLLELLSFVWRQRWLSDLGDQVCRRRFGQAIYQDTKKGNLDKDIEAEPKAKKNTSAILEP